MNDFLTQYKKVSVIVIAALMILFFGFCNVVDIMGKANLNGFQVIFAGKGLGFDRFIAFLRILLPILVIIKECIESSLSGKIKDTAEQIAFIAMAVLFLLFIVCLPQMAGAAVGAYLYFLMSLVGLVVCYLPKITKK